MPTATRSSCQARAAARAWTPVQRNGRAAWQRSSTTPALADERQLLETAGAAAGLALENERLHAELRARVDELERSRERLIEVGLAERRKLERNLHDGAQQRLVALALSLRLARDRVDPRPRRRARAARRGDDRARLRRRRSCASSHAGSIPPCCPIAACLPALRALAGRVPLDVELVETPEQSDCRRASRSRATTCRRGAHERRQVCQAAQRRGPRDAAQRLGRRSRSPTTAIGGADPAHGSGLRGLVDRVAALDGRLEVDSPPGGGTTISAQIPCA